MEDEFLLAIKSFASAKRTPDQYLKLDELFRLDAAATSTWRAGVRPSPRHVLLTLIKDVWSYTFQDYFRMKKEREQVRPPLLIRS